MERDPLVRGVLLLIGAIGLIWLAGWLWEIVGRFSDILLLFFLAWLLAFVLNPAARRLQQLGTPRVFAVGLVYLGLLFLVIVAGIFIIPAAATQLFELSSSLPVLVNDLQLRLNELQVTLLRLGVSDEQLNEFNRDMMGRAQAIGAVLVANGLTIATTVVGSLLQASIVLILSFYIMLDGDRIGALYIALLPPRFRAGAMTAFENVDRTFGGFVRGQLIQSAFFGFGTAAVMVAAHLPYNLVLSILAGVAMIIPVVGPYIAIGPPVILTVILQPQDTWWVFTSLFILQFVVINVLMPRIMSQSVGLHPLLVFAAVLVGARVGGGWGAIFGVPVAAMLFLLIRVFYLRVVRQSPLYVGEGPITPESLVPPAVAPVVPPAVPPVVPPPAVHPPSGDRSAPGAGAAANGSSQAAGVAPSVAEAETKTGAEDKPAPRSRTRHSPP